MALRLSRAAAYLSDASSSVIIFLFLDTTADLFYTQHIQLMCSRNTATVEPLSLYQDTSELRTPL